ncbi:hypothetical protein BD770DRAFT_415668 [Pilaira anomala]|nr:hypothetical protein BD770DRAFT_415668 [Pilaira anomala]
MALCRPDSIYGLENDLLVQSRKVKLEECSLIFTRVFKNPIIYGIRSPLLDKRATQFKMNYINLVETFRSMKTKCKVGRAIGGAREDGMLLLSVHIHGFGSWLDIIREDKTLGLSSKLFIGANYSDEKHKPKATDLERRIDQLMK